MNDKLQVLQSNDVVGLVAITDVIERCELKLQWNVITKLHHTDQGNIHDITASKKVLFLCATRFYVSVGQTVLLIMVFVLQTIQRWRKETFIIIRQLHVDCCIIRCS